MSLKNPMWIRPDILMYRDLFYTRQTKELTPEQEEFCTRMYHLEEYMSGLDGDR